MKAVKGQLQSKDQLEAKSSKRPARRYNHSGKKLIKRENIYKNVNNLNAELKFTQILLSANKKGKNSSKIVHLLHF